MTQDTLNDLLVRIHFIQIRRGAAPKAMPAIPFQPDQLYNRTDDSSPNFADVVANAPFSE
jgi:hypothetical protein